MAVIEVEVQGSVVVVTLNRPEKRNAINGAMARGLEAAIDRLEHDESVRVGILRAVGGPGRAVFCAGHDLSTGPEGDDDAVTALGGFAGLVRRARTKPLIAAVNGLATAGGLEIVLACDLVVASTDARFALAEAKWNLVAGGGGLFRLTRAVGRPVAMDLLLTGDEIDGQRAHQLGLVSRITSPAQLDTLAIEIAATIAGHGPQAIRLSRRIATLAEHLDDQAAWSLTEQAYAEVSTSEDVQEGMRAFRERRAPTFKGR